MLATNHGTTGMILGALLPLQIAIPVAFVSHLAMDALPHYGIANKKRNASKSYGRIVRIDTAVALSFAVISAATGHWAMFIVGWVAYSPDAYWVYLYAKTKSMNLVPRNRFSKFHKNIQRYERPWGIWLELPLACLLSFIVFALF